MDTHSHQPGNSLPIMIIGSGIISTGNAIPDVNMHSRPNTLANALTAISEHPTDPSRNPQATAIKV